MSNNKNILRTEHAREIGRREATILEHDSIRVMIDDIGGMIPELSTIQGKKRINAHWLLWRFCGKYSDNEAAWAVFV